MSGLIRNKLLLLILFLCAFAKVDAQQPFRIVFYNVENLYDTINNPQTLDDDLTPEGNLRWKGYRYHKKLEDISKVISSVGKKYPPAIVGLCEVENDSVMKALTQKSSLAKHKYEYIITKSTDPRGSNVALLYQRDEMKVIQHRSYTPVIDKENGRKTRDVLHVVGRVASGDTLDLLVCHYPSRREGVVKSRPYRIEVSRLLRQKVDSLYKKRKDANIIIMGDFNDYPFDESMKDVLGAKSLKEKVVNTDLYNLFLHHGKQMKELASYKYQGKWNYLDQFVVSGQLLSTKNSLYIIDALAEVYSPDYLLTYDEKYGGMKPFRTYSGWKYLGGTSDHLPIYIDLYIRE